MGSREDFVISERGIVSSGQNGGQGDTTCLGLGGYMGYHTGNFLLYY